MSRGSEPPKSDANRSQALLLVIAYVGFVSLGLPDPVAGVAWPFVRDVFSLSQSSFGLVFIALGCGYCASGFFGGKLTQILGLGNLLWISSGLVAVAMLGSSLAPVWPLFVACGIVWGLGSGGIDAGLNAYVSSRFSSQHVNWLHACYSLGATLGPLLMTAALVRTGSWRLGYGIVGGLLLLMTILFLITRRRWDEPAPSTDRNIAPSAEVGLRDALREPLVWLQVVLFFLYVGLEFTVGQWCFTLMTESRGVAAGTAGMLAGAYYGAIGVGRIAAGVVAQRIGLDRLLRGSMTAALVGAAIFAFAASAELSYAGLILIGLGLAPVFPCLMARTPQRLGEAYAVHAVGFQVSAGMLGAALIPALAGVLAETWGLEFVAEFAVLLAGILFLTHELLLNVARRRNR